ncbi:MAG: UPF0175 family protein [Nanoarchaeota archaeon]
MDNPITTRLPNEFLIGIKKIAEKENLDVSTVIRRLLAKSIVEWKIEYALERYAKGEYSFGEAVKFAEISPWDFPNLLKQKKIPINVDEEELEADLKTIKKLH